jgi:serine O-acetyltransferase
MITLECKKYNDILNKKMIIEFGKKIQDVLFPNYFREVEDYEKNLEDAHIYFKKYISSKDGDEEKFFEELHKVKELLLTDIEAMFNGDPACESYDEVILCYPGFYAIMVNRIAHALYNLGIKIPARILTEEAHSKTGIDIHPGATIGSYFFIDHGTGIVIGETTIIGDHVKLYQGVTLGALSLSRGQLLKGSKRHPTIGNNVTIYSGASILGGETIVEDNVTLGANVFVTSSVSKSSKVAYKSLDLTCVPFEDKK